MALLLAAPCIAAQAQQPDPDALAIAVGGSFAKPKILPKLDKLGIAQVSVDFKQVTSKAVTKTEKKLTPFGKANGASATASLTAYLETTDGELTDADYQEITDHLYYYLQQKLKENGIDTVAWSAVTATNFYKDGKEPDETKAGEEEKKNGQSWVSYSAFHGNSMYNGGPVSFAFGKIKKASNFSEDLGAPVAFFHTTVDFVEIIADVDVSSHSNHDYFDPAIITTYKSKTQAGALMKVPANAGLSLFWNQKSQSEMLTVAKDIPAGVKYESTLDQDPGRAEKRSKLFAISLSKKMESVPVVISTTREQYKMAAKKALENYADDFIAKIKAVKKD